jgi:hypothetical protein
MGRLVQYAPTLAVAAVGLGIAGYIAALALATFLPDALGGRGAQLAAAFTSHTAQNIGVPCAAVSAFAIVAALLRAFPPSTHANGQVQLKAFGLEFTGPSGPVTLWLMCFLGFVSALRLLRV